MRNNPIQFAVVREDPELEMALIDAFQPKRILLIASGGCTALSLSARYSDLQISVIDSNPSQLELLRLKRKILLNMDQATIYKDFNVLTDHATGLNAAGNFESLFRSLRRFLEDFVFSHDDIETIFSTSGDEASKRKLLTDRFANKFWPVAFELHFSDALLNCLFTDAATQHAPKGSYPAYFRKLFEKSLSESDAPSNYFLAHVFLGHYRPPALPLYLQSPQLSKDFQYLNCRIEDCPDLDLYDLVCLSNIFDWMPLKETQALSLILSKKMREDSILLFRQLNNVKDYRSVFTGFEFDEALGRELHKRDKTFFYSKTNIAFRRGSKNENSY